MFSIFNKVLKYRNNFKKIIRFIHFFIYLFINVLYDKKNSINSYLVMF